MKTARVSLGRFLKPTFATAAILYLVFAVGRNIHGIKTMPTPQFGWLLLGLVLFAGHYFIQSVGWHMILRGLGQPVSWSDSLKMWYGSLVARWIPGPLVYSAARLVAAREAKLSVTAIAFGVLLELSYVLLGSMVATLLFISSLLPSLMASPTIRSFATAGLIALAFGGVVALRPSTLTSLCRVALFRKAVRKVAGEDLPETGLPAMSFGRSLCLLAYYSMFWVYSGLMFGVLACAFMPMSAERWAICIPAFPSSWLIGFLSVLAPQGLGVREGVMSAMLGRVMPVSSAMVLAVTSRLMMFLTEFLSVAVVWAIGRYFGQIAAKRTSMTLPPTGSFGLPATQREQ